MKTIIMLVLVFLLSNLVFAQSSGQVIYNDFEPDVCATYLKNWSGTTPMPADTLLIDFNSDFIMDLMFYFSGPAPHLIAPYYKTCDQNIYICHSNNDTLSSSSLIWFRGPALFAGDTGDKFGFKIVDEENAYYGWYRAYISSNDTAVFINVDKMAYCTIPNYPLLWGQTEISNSVPKTDAGNNGVKINFNNAANTVQIESLTKIKNVEIVSSNGQISGKSKNVNKTITEINASGLQSGVYIVKVVLEDGRVVSGKVVR